MARHFVRNAVQLLNTTVESRISSFLQPYLLPLYQTPEPTTSYQTSLNSPPHSTPLDFTRDFSVLLSKRRQGDIMTSEYLHEEDRGYWSRSDRDVKKDLHIDFEAECPQWMIDRKGREWRPALPRFIEGVIVELTTRKPIKPNSGNRKIAKVQVTINGTPRVVSARIPGENNTLQLHHRVLVQWGRARNLPSVKFVIVRGHLDAQY